MISKKPILVTGSHRSGTTWVGRVIDKSPSVGYIHEPLNLNNHPGICGAKFDYWFPYISKKNESTFYEHIKKTINFKYNLIGEITSIMRPLDLVQLAKDFSSFFLYRFSNIRPLIKDPIAVFSAEWLASKFDMDVVILIRHPAAFASSLKRLNWTHPFSHFLKQPLLMEDHLYPFESEIREYAEKEHDIIDQAILLWKIIHHMIIKYKKKHKDWIFIRHEELSRAPLQGFRYIFKKLNVEFSRDIREFIKEYSFSKNPSEAPTKRTDFIKLNSRLNIWNWKRRLKKSEIEYIRTHVEDFSRVFYSDEDW